MFSEEVVISARSLSKTYRLFGHPGDRVKQFFSFGLRQYHREFRALENVSFEVRRGETIGIIGRNGSGKSTLLQLVCGILKPTYGSIDVGGRVSALLELGAGFNPEFTGRENVFFQGALVGLSRVQMDERFDAIAAFADIGEFVDQPVRTYSSGMFVRLAFAVAISVEPDILVVDEALAVGDARFQSKCFRRIHELRERGGSILFVTHATEQITRFCDRALLIDRGTLVQIGTPKEIVERHLSSMFLVAPREGEIAGGTEQVMPFSSRPGYNAGEFRFGSGAAEILDYWFSREDGSSEMLRFLGRQKITLHFRVAFHQHIERATFAVALSMPDENVVFGVNSRDLTGSTAVGPFGSGSEVTAVFDLTMYLARGDYLVSLSVSEDVGGQLTPLDRRYQSICISVDNPLNQRGFADLEPQFSIIINSTEDVS